jgi:hypothetical protein
MAAAGDNNLVARVGSLDRKLFPLQPGSRGFLVLSDASTQQLVYIISSEELVEPGAVETGVCIWWEGHDLG